MHGYGKIGTAAGLYEQDELSTNTQNINCYDIEIEHIACKIDFDTVYSSKLEIKQLWQQIR